MPDKYSSFDELFRNETAGTDFSIAVRLAGESFAVIAPHGGGIEAGTSEIADALSAEDFSYYAFNGLKLSGNADLHITSTHFDEPMSLIVTNHSSVVITIHGEESEAESGGAVFLGGLDRELGRQVGAALQARRFDVRHHPNPLLQGLEPTNLCNRGRSGKGVQLELSRGLRRGMFSSLSREGRRHTTSRFTEFVDAVRSVISGETQLLRAFEQGRA
jgi:phage replication-related protein YjqB (UPF0714/DUF867 family)